MQPAITTQPPAAPGAGGRLPQIHPRDVAPAGTEPGVVDFSYFEVVDLPEPRLDRTVPLMQALKARHSERDYASQPLSLPDLSDLLWSALGVNRSTGERTVPFWRHVMAIDLYVALAEGVWLYEPKPHRLCPYLAMDLRGQTGLQDFVATAPVNLIYVARGDDMQGLSEADRRLYASVDAAFIGQNVYLFCAAAGLATVFRGALDQSRLGHALMLPSHQFVTFAQSVGHPYQANA